ncbi:MAG: glycosyltransferase family 39 protein, partial [Pyrinomonadaceae bacterium]
MTRPRSGRDMWRVARASLAFIVVFALGVFLYTIRLRHNPPGFYVDESSVAYNAYTISQTGRDEFGEAWPLFFRAFGDYKNPIYVYLLAAVFSITGPGILAARLLSAIAGLSAAWLMGLLGTRVTRRRDVGLFAVAATLLTPWLFEMSRVVLEVALYPLAVILFLLCLHRVSTKESWTWPDAASLAATLAMLTYTYSIGRLFAPLLALGLVIFATRARLSGLLRTWALYALTLLPMFIFQRRHPDALTGRFNLITYITPQTSFPRIVWEFVKHFAGNLDPRRLLLSGDENVWQVAHVQGTPAVLFITMALALGGLWLVLRRHIRDAWWRFVLYGLAASIVPASLTADYFHTLRLAALPVFLLVLMLPALAWLCDEALPRPHARRAALVACVSLMLLQGAIFQWRYHASERDAWRHHLFDADYASKIFDPALAYRDGPVYLADAMTTPYIQADWYATLRGVPLSRFIRLAPDESPPAGALVISTEESCAPAHVLARTEPYTLYLAST